MIVRKWAVVNILSEVFSVVLCVNSELVLLKRVAGRARARRGGEVVTRRYCAVN